MTNKMQIYSVMVEGIDASMGFFMNIEVAASDSRHATELALERARQLGLTITGVEEITRTRQTSSSGEGVLSSISGKSYFPIEQ
jgi:hypothetical protein